MKAIVIGTSLAGKTTLIRCLRTKVTFPTQEIDEELTRINGGSYPTDNGHKHMVLIPNIVKDILGRENIVFFTNTDYFTDEDLLQARKNGFQIIQLFLGLEQLQQRNKVRVENQGYSDVSQWLTGMVAYQIRLQEKNLVDKVIDADQAIEIIANELLGYLK